MAEYLVLIYEDEAAWENPGAGTVEQMMNGHRLFGQRNASALRGGNALQATSTATSLRRDPTGDFVVTDGPFAETKEALGWLLPHRSRRPGRGAGPGQADPGAVRRGRGPPDPDLRLSGGPDGAACDAAVESAVADAHRREWAFVLAATVRVTGDIDMAEECVQDAYARALATWPTGGIPAKPGRLADHGRPAARHRRRRARLSTHERALPVARGTGAAVPCPENRTRPDDRPTTGCA